MGHPGEWGGIPSKSPERGILKRITEKMFRYKLLDIYRGINVCSGNVKQFVLLTYFGA